MRMICVSIHPAAHVYGSIHICCSAEEKQLAVFPGEELLTKQELGKSQEIERLMNVESTNTINDSSMCGQCAQCSQCVCVNEAPRPV